MSADYANGLAQANTAERIAAFGAIRRAIKVAHEAEKWSGIHAYEGFIMARGVRAGIRAAIGSEKA